MGDGSGVGVEGGWVGTVVSVGAATGVLVSGTCSSVGVTRGGVSPAVQAENNMTTADKIIISLCMSFPLQVKVTQLKDQVLKYILIGTI